VAGVSRYDPPMPRRPRPRTLTDSQLVSALVEELVKALLLEPTLEHYVESLWRESRKRGLAGNRHHGACVCSDCIDYWNDGIHDPDPDLY